MDYKFNGNQIEIDPPKKPKKMTATRFASVLGLNAWSTPFEVWCAITRLYEEPFEDTIYTVAGKTIEPKICDYLRKRYFMDIKSPTDAYGEDYFKKTWGDFFGDREILGGMWDFLGDDFVVEVKTTKRSEDWIGKDGKPMAPIYYKLQACLYAYLLGFDDVVMTCSFLKDADYTNPDAFVPTVDNTVVIQFKLSEEYPNFKEEYVDPAIEWWKTYIEGGISPEFDEKKDAEILKALRKNTVAPNDKEIAKLLKKADQLQAKIDKLKDTEDQLKEIKDQIKEYMKGQFRDGDKNVELTGSVYRWTLTKASRTALDSKSLKSDEPEIFKKYSKSSETLTLKNAPIEA
ncbi:MAG: hypothetical protein PHC95_05095 [Parabacteroides sp.]|nr:hypothetical protein [Parabacteroides sp.]